MNGAGKLPTTVLLTETLGRQGPAVLALHARSHFMAGRNAERWECGT